jgi:orotate phosphoribosyltransferase
VRVPTHAALATAVRDACHLTGEFTLRSGTTATDYFDKYQFEARPDLLAAVAEALTPLIPKDIEVLAGLELGGIPIVTALSLRTGLPAAFVRKQAKTYGTARLAEGADVAGRRVLVVEDVATTAGQMLMSTADLRERGALVSTALVVIDREAGGCEAMAGVGVELRALFTRTDLGS